MLTNKIFNASALHAKPKTPQPSSLLMWQKEKAKQQQKRSPASLNLQPARATPISSPWVRTRYPFPVLAWQIGLRVKLLVVKRNIIHTSPLRQKKNRLS